jgi:hypothetical protein
MAELYYDANKTAPAEKASAVTPSDSTVLTDVRGLYVGADGDVAVIMVGDTSAVTFVGVKAGTVLPLRVSKVMSTNTTATDIVALY